MNILRVIFKDRFRWSQISRCKTLFFLEPRYFLPIFSGILIISLCFMIQSCLASKNNKKNGDILLKPVVAKVFTDPNLRNGIARLYDEASMLWENIWGEHLHHGYFETKPGRSIEEQKKAQVQMIEQMIKWSKIETKPLRILDLGCGLGGSSRYLAKKYNSVVDAITLSKYQSNRATQLCKMASLSHLIRVQVADALNMPFKNDSFDLVWALESAEHIPNKESLIQQIKRVMIPGGKVVIATWCHRNLSEEEKDLSPREKKLLQRISRCYSLPLNWWSIQDYKDCFVKSGFCNIRTADWTDYVQYFWPAVIKSALTVRGLIGLLKCGFGTINAALTMLLMIRGYRQGLIKYALITAHKPVNIDS